MKIGICAGDTVRPAKGMTYKRVEIPSGKVRAIPPVATLCGE